MTLYRANFDYESELYWGKRDNWAVELLEHFFFYCCHEDQALYSYKNYPRDYLAHVKSLTEVTPAVKHYGSPMNWWGKLEDIPTERKINSKITSYEVGKRLDLNHSKSTLISCLSELEGFFSEEKDIFLRHPHERSGRVSFRISNLEDFEKNRDKLKKILLRQPVLGDVFFHNRHWDLGTCFTQKNEAFEPVFQIKNLNDKGGVFRGGILLDEMVVTEELKMIADSYYKLGARDALQVDSFAHDGGINWLCEVNYRRTMGYIIDRLKKLAAPGDCIALLITPSSWMLPFSTIGEMLNTAKKVKGVIPLSPAGNPLLGWLLHGDSREELFINATEWWKKCSRKPENFPEVYNDIIPNRNTPIMGTPI